MMIGRKSERARIAAILAGARVGESGVLVLTGEAGIGKTALLDAAVASADGMQVLRATGIEAEREVPFGGLLQLLRPALHLIDAIPAPQAEALSAALALRVGTAADRFAVGAGTLSLICKAAERRPVALLVDDAHLLDRPSAEALAFAARRLLADPVAFLATVRSREHCALTEAGLPEVQVGALDLASAAELVAQRWDGAVPAELLDRLHRATGGNPLALLELSADLESLVRLPPDAPVPVPRTVADAVARETARLDGAARTALLVAAASGGDLPLVLRAIGLLGIEPAALERAERERLLTISDDRVVFRHPLVRSSVYRAAGPDERRAVHRALFTALPEPEVDRRAWHLAEAVSGPDEEAADLLESAAVLARSRSADAVAATAFCRAATLSVGDAGAVRRLVSAGESAWLAGQVRRSRTLLAEALRRASAPEQRVRAQEVLGAIAARSGSLVEARDLLSAAASEAEAIDPDLAVTLLADAVHASAIRRGPARRSSGSRST
jgi:predicted ATPase